MTKQRKFDTRTERLNGGLITPSERKQINYIREHYNIKSDRDLLLTLAKREMLHIIRKENEHAKV